MRKREAQSFYDDFSIRRKPRATPAARPRRALKVNRLLRTLKLHSLTFLKSQKSSAYASGAWRHSHPAVIFSIWDFYFDIFEWHILPARAWTPALMLHRTNPGAKRKVLSLTKPKGKIYKTKSLGHYIPHVRKRKKREIKKEFYLVWFYGISTIVGYSEPNPFLYI